ncbi:hypothetical protein EGP91_00325 [bacterium]|uniref:hypothetical protein n=1 Tax=Candidatus Ventrenecus sp. TaxID=3085654 RepID=UPI001DED70B9|nr:hypothetical protein [bacterium]
MPNNSNPSKKKFYYNLILLKEKKQEKLRFMIFEVAEHLKILKDGKRKYTLEQAVEELNKAQELLNPIMDKYDYKKLPKKN